MSYVNIIIYFNLCTKILNNIYFKIEGSVIVCTVHIVLCKNKIIIINIFKLNSKKE